MGNRNIIVIGASAGGFEAIKELVAGLPADLGASIFIVWHMAPDLRGILPDVLQKDSALQASNACDKEPILSNHIYVAPPDRHLLLEDGRVRVTRGPKENRFRPAVDPLFRSAAYVYGPRVIGIVLSGALDDGTSGLWMIKQHGGIAVVQDPHDAAVASMPENALKQVSVDYCVPVTQMADLLVKLCAEDIPIVNSPIVEEQNKRTEEEIRIALQDGDMNYDISQFGKLTPYACPECHGVLSGLAEGGRVRFRCHTGHAYSEDSLLIAITEKIDDSLWNAIRGVEESILLLNHMGDHFAEHNQLKLASGYFRKAGEAGERLKLMRQALLSHEQLSAESIEKDVAAERGSQSAE